jgi:uncharacterized membrane protein
MWIFYSLLSAFLMAVVNLIDKFVLTQWVRKPVVPLLVLGLIGLFPALVVLFVQGFPPPAPGLLLPSFLAGASFVLMSFFYFSAAQAEDISRVVPLFYLSPLFVSALAAAFLGEVFPAKKYAGVILLVAGAVLMNVKRNSSLRGRPGRAFRQMILAALFLAAYTVLTKRALAASDFWIVFAWTRLSMLAVLIPFYFREGRELRAAVRERGLKVAGLLTFNETLAMASTLFITIALSSGFATLVTTLSSVQPFFVLVLAVFMSIFFPKFLREETNRSVLALKLAAISLMFSGAALVA